MVGTHTETEDMRAKSQKSWNSSHSLAKWMNSKNLVTSVAWWWSEKSEWHYNQIGLAYGFELGNVTLAQ